jgi:hypothetical protein
MPAGVRKLGFAHLIFMFARKVLGQRAAKLFHQQA